MNELEYELKELECERCPAHSLGLGGLYRAPRRRENGVRAARPPPPWIQGLRIAGDPEVKIWRISLFVR